MATDGRLNEIPLKPIRLGGWRWLALYAGLSMVIQWPLVGSLTTHISYGQEQEITVPMLNLWTVWWNADRAALGFRGYWNSPIFYPAENTFAFSEAQPSSLIAAPIVWLTGNRGLAYNVYQLFILALNGFSAHRLLRRLGHIPWLALCGGVMSQILPFVLWQFGVAQLTTLFGINWTLHAVLDLFATETVTGRRTNASEQLEGCEAAMTSNFGTANSLQNQPLLQKRLGGSLGLPVLKWLANSIGVRLGLAYGMTYWLCNYWGLFLALLLVPSSICFWNRRLFELSFWRNIALAGAIAVPMIGPFVWLQRALAREHNWQTTRTEEMVRNLSAHVRDHTDVPWNTLISWLEFPEAARNNGWALGGGGLKLLLVPIGLVAALATSRRRRWGLFSLTFGAMAFGLSLGPTVRFVDGVPLVGGVCPYELLQQYVLGFSLIRSPFRFAMFVQLTAVWLSVEALDLLNPGRWLTRQTMSTESRRWRLPSVLVRVFGFAYLERPQDPSLARRAMLFDRVGAGRWFDLRLVPLVLVSTLVTLEAVPPTMRLYELPLRDGLPVWVTWLRDSAEPNSAIACLPFPRGYQVGDYEETALWMYWGTFHRRPLLNGYSGFFPSSFNLVKEGLEQFQRPANLGADAAYEPQFAHYAWDNPGLKRLNESGVRYAVVKRSFATRDDVWTHPATRFRWALVVSDETEKIDVYEISSLDD